MAKITVKQIGGPLMEKEATTVGELKSQLNLPNYTASVNGDPVDDSYTLEDYEFVTLAQAVKGGV